MKEISHKQAMGVILWYMNKMGYYAWTSYWNTIYYIDKESMTNSRLKRHELMHVEQMKREGKFMFTVKYMWQAFTVGYKNNPYEVEARKAEEG